MQATTIAGLITIVLPDVTLRYCDGAFVKWGADVFDCSDETFGVIGAIQTPEEGVGDEIPNFQLTFLPKSTAVAADLSQPNYQGCSFRSWTAEIDPDTNEVVGTPWLEIDGQVDSTDLVIDRGVRDLEMTVSSQAARLLVINEGNTLSPRFHKSIYPGELGEDNAIGIGVGVAWGTAAPAQTYSPAYGGGYGAGSGGGGNGRNFSEQLL